MADLHSGNGRVTAQENLSESGFSASSINLVNYTTESPNTGHWGPTSPTEPPSVAAHRLPFTPPIIIPNHDLGPYTPYPGSTLGYCTGTSGSHTPSSAETSLGPPTPFSQHSVPHCDVRSPSSASFVGVSPFFGGSTLNAMGGPVPQQLNSPSSYPYLQDVQQGRLVQYVKQDTPVGLLLETGPGPRLQDSLELPLQALPNDPSVPLPSLLSMAPACQDLTGLTFRPGTVPAHDNVYCSPDNPAFTVSPSSDTPYNTPESPRAEATSAEFNCQQNGTFHGWSPNTAQLFDAGARTVSFPYQPDCSSPSAFHPFDGQNVILHPPESSYLYSPEGHGLRKIDPTSSKIRDAADKKRIRPQKFECEICGDKLTSKQNLKNHYNSHTGVSPFQCSNCEKVYRHSRSLNRHREAAHPSP